MPLYFRTFVPISTDNNQIWIKRKFFLVFGVGVVRFQNTVCQAANGLVGTCYTRWQCSSIGGYGSGKCAQIASCCVGKYVHTTL